MGRFCHEDLIIPPVPKKIFYPLIFFYFSPNCESPKVFVNPSHHCSAFCQLGRAQTSPWGRCGQPSLILRFLHSWQRPTAGAQPTRALILMHNDTEDGLPTETLPHWTTCWPFMYQSTHSPGTRWRFQSMRRHINGHLCFSLAVQYNTLITL